MTTYCGQWAWKELQAPDFLPVGQRHLWPASPAPVCHEHAAELEAQGIELFDAHPDRTPLQCMVIVEPPQYTDGVACDDYEPADGDPGGCAHCAAVDSEHADMKGYSSD